MMKRNMLFHLRDAERLNEKELLMQLASGHESAFEIIYNTYWKIWKISDDCRLASWRAASKPAGDLER